MKKQLTPTEQAALDFFYVFDLEECLKSLDDVFELAMDNDQRPSGYDFQVYRLLKTLLQKIKPPQKAKLKETTYWKCDHV